MKMYPKQGTKVRITKKGLKTTGMYGQYNIYGYVKLFHGGNHFYNRESFEVV